MKSFQLGPVQLSFAWASDLKWDWTSDVGDQHAYVVSLGLVRRQTKNGPFSFLLGTLGPLWVSLAWGSR